MEENKKENKVLLVSPYSSRKVGGIGTWTKYILEYNEKHGQFDLVFLNTAFRFKFNIVRNNAQRLIYGIFDSIFVIALLLFKIIRYYPKTIHYTSSASYALIKDLLAIYIAKLVGIKFIIHWHFGRIPELSERRNSEWKMLKKVINAAHISIVLDQNSLKCLNNNGLKNVILIPNPISENLNEKAKSVI
jgi:glycosyltransferase involved in cell wall biosynthesis